MATEYRVIGLTTADPNESGLAAASQSLTTMAAEGWRPVTPIVLPVGALMVLERELAPSAIGAAV